MIGNTPVIYGCLSHLLAAKRCPDQECVIQSLLRERANPDGCGGSGGLSCLHLAVARCILKTTTGDKTDQ